MIDGIGTYGINGDLTSLFESESTTASGSKADREYAAFGLTGDTVDISEEGLAALQAKMEEYEGMTSDDLTDEQKDELKGLIGDAFGLSDTEVDELAERMEQGPPPPAEGMGAGMGEGQAADASGQAAATGQAGQSGGAQAGGAVGGTGGGTGGESGTSTEETLEDQIERVEEEIKELEQEIQKLQAKAQRDETAAEELKAKQIELTGKQSELAELESQQAESQG